MPRKLRWRLERLFAVSCHKPLLGCGPARGETLSTLAFTVTVPTDAGYIGRECNSNECGRYFKVHEHSLREHMYCPYCGLRFAKESLFTREQSKHIEAQAMERAKEYVYGEIDKVFGSLVPFPVAVDKS
jgi:hypothetical protein